MTRAQPRVTAAPSPLLPPVYFSHEAVSTQLLANQGEQISSRASSTHSGKVAPLLSTTHAPTPYYVANP